MRCAVGCMGRKLCAVMGITFLLICVTDLGHPSAYMETEREDGRTRRGNKKFNVMSYLCHISSSSDSFKSSCSITPCDSRAFCAMYRFVIYRSCDRGLRPAVYSRHPDLHGSSVVHKFMKMVGDRKRGNGFDTTPQSDSLRIRWCYISHRIYDIFEFTFIQDMETLVSSNLRELNVVLVKLFFHDLLQYSQYKDLRLSKAHLRVPFVLEFALCRFRARADCFGIISYECP